MYRFYVIARDNYPTGLDKYYNRETKKWVSCVLPECMYHTQSLAILECKEVAGSRVRIVEFTLR
jgi:hypothetical protein